MALRIRTDRASAVIYLAWEFGIERARKLLSGADSSRVRRQGAWVEIEMDMFLIPHRGRRRTVAAARVWIERIREAVAYQRGRMGAPNTHTLAEVLM